MMMRLSLLFLLGIAMLLVGCETPSPVQDMREMKFAIDSSLIDQRYFAPDSGFSFSPPIHFTQFSSAELALFAQDAEKMQNGSEPVKSQFIAVFGDSLTRGLLIVSEISHSASNRMKSIEYDQLLRESTDSAKVNTHKFLKNGKTVFLFATRDEEYFSYLLFFESQKGELIQLNYQIPVDVNISFSGAMESSIGTLEF